MRVILIAAAVALAGCGSSSTPAPEKAETKAAPAPAPAPRNNSAFLPTENQTRALVMPGPLLGNKALPGGTVGDYAGPAPYQLFIVETDSAQDAAILLLDWKGTLTNPDFDAGFGGYFGTDNGKPVFGFTKGKYLVGVFGLDHKTADPIARVLAARIH